MPERRSASAPPHPSLRYGGGGFAVFLIVSLAVVTGMLSMKARRMEIDAAGESVLHGLLDIATVVLAGMIASLAWQAAKTHGAALLVTVAAGMFAAGLFGTGHLLSHPGMPPFGAPPAVDGSLYFWYAERISVAVTLFAAVLVVPASMKPAVRHAVLGGALAWVAATSWLAAHPPDWLVASFAPQHGRMPLALGIGYLVVTLHAAAALVLYPRLRTARDEAAMFLFAALGILVLGEINFTLHTRTHDVFDLMGHACKITGYILLYRAIFVIAIQRPYRELTVSQNTLQKSEQRFRMLFESAPDALFLIDASGCIVTVNASAVAMLGYRHEELFGLPMERMFRERIDDSPLPQNGCRVVRPAPDLAVVKTESLVRRRDGEELPVSVNLSRIELGGTCGTLIALRDISATREMENMLRRHSQEFQTLVEHAPDIIARVDRAQHFLYANSALAAAIGSEPDDCWGKTWVELGLPPDAAIPWIHGVDAVFASGEPVTLECGVELPHAGLRHFHVRMAPERDFENRVVSVLVIARDISERKQHEEALLYQAGHDALTGLPNRTLILDRLRQAIAHARRSERLLAVAYLDLDRFKDVNDTLGHGAGDVLLRQAAARIGAVLREDDTVGRQGGDEFILLLPDIVQLGDAAGVAEKILAALAQPFAMNGREVYVTASLGLSVCPLDAADAEVLLRNADVAMYRAKEEGRNTFRFYVPEMDAQMHARIELEHDLRLALKRDELVLHYQPRVSLASGTVLGFEALVRWNHPREGLLGPDRFIGVAEATGLITQLGEWVLEEACRCIRQWQARGLPQTRVAVNLSARQFRDPELVARVQRVIADTGIDPAHLELEITESTVMQDSKAAAGTLHALKTLGLTLSVDDFGTGYSSLSYLKLFPIDALKIDRSFVRDIATDPGDAAIVRAIVNLSRSLGLAVIAEGVEDAEQAVFLRDVGCDEFQGYWFSRPLPETSAEALLRSGRGLDEGMMSHEALAQAGAVGEGTGDAGACA